MARLLRLHISEDDRYGDTPLYEAIVTYCITSGIAGATVFRGLEGYGDMGEIHRGGLLHHDRPVVVTIVDQPEKIDRLIRELEARFKPAFMAISDVEHVRIENGHPIV